MNRTPDIQTTEAAGASESERQLGAVNGYPSLRPVTTGVLTGVEREGSGRSSLMIERYRTALRQYEQDGTNASYDALLDAFGKLTNAQQYQVEP